MDSIKKQARRAGLVYFLLGITAPIGLIYVPSRIVVSGDAAATADRIRASEWLLRLGIASELVHQIIGIFLVLMLFRLFKDVSVRHAVTMVVMSLTPVPIVMICALCEVMAIVLVRHPEFMSTFEPRQLDSLAYLFLRLRSRGIDVASIFWGLWLFPFAILVIRSGFIPRLLGYLMMVAGVGYLIAAFASLVAPPIAPITNTFTMLLEFGELPIMFWLLIWGARERTAAT